MKNTMTHTTTTYKSPGLWGGLGALSIGIFGGLLSYFLLEMSPLISALLAVAIAGFMIFALGIDVDIVPDTRSVRGGASSISDDELARLIRRQISHTPGMSNSSDAPAIPVTRLAKDILYDDLKSLSLRPTREGTENILFRYQGGYFQATNLNSEMIRIIYPRLYSTDASRQDFLCRLLNRVNSSYSIARLSALATGNEGEIEVHAYADFYYTSLLRSRTDFLQDVLTIFFELQRALLVATGMDDIMSDDPTLAHDQLQSSYRDFSLN